MIEIRAREKSEEDRIASMRNEQAKEMERLIRDVQGQAAQREKALKEELEAAGREQRRRLTEMSIEQGRRIDKYREEPFRSGLEADTGRDKELPAVLGDCETKTSERVDAELKGRSVASSRVQAIHEKRLRVAEKVLS